MIELRKRFSKAILATMITLFMCGCGGTAPNVVTPAGTPQTEEEIAELRAIYGKPPMAPADISKIVEDAKAKAQTQGAALPQ